MTVKGDFSVLGFDPGISAKNGTGVALVRASDRSVLYRHFVVVQGETDIDKLSAVFTALTEEFIIAREVAVQNASPLTAVVYELPIMGPGNMRTLNALGRLCGIIHALALTYLPLSGSVIEVAPATVKKKFAGHGAAKKVDMRTAYVELYGSDIAITEGEIDAVAIAHCGLRT